MSENNDDNKKLTNPKDSVGIAKVPFSTVPMQVMAEVGLAMMEGALKYGRANYRIAGVRASVYFDAFMRHVTDWWEGQDIDPASNLSHITKAIASLTVLRDAMMNDMWEDDRPPKVKNQRWVEEMNAKARDLIAKYPDPVPAFTEKGRSELMPTSGVSLVSVHVEKFYDGKPLTSDPDPHDIGWSDRADAGDDIPF